MQVNQWNCRVKGFGEEGAKGGALDVMRSGSFIWGNLQLRKYFGVCLGWRLPAWRELKEDNQEVVWCIGEVKYIWDGGELDKFWRRVKSVSVSFDVGAD